MKRKQGLKTVREGLESKRLSVFVTVYSAIFIYLITVLQTSLVQYLKIGDASFDLLITGAFLLSIYTNEYYGAVYGVIAGALFDMINASAFPVMPVVALFLCAKCGSIFCGMKKGYFIRKFIAVAVCTLIRSGVTFLVEAGRHENPFSFLIACILPSFLYTMVLSPLVMLVTSPVGHEGRSGGSFR